MLKIEGRDFLCPFQIYNSNIINQYGSDVFNKHFNPWGISANPDTFRLFRCEVAHNQTDEFLKSEIHNLEKEEFKEIPEYVKSALPHCTI